MIVGKFAWQQEDVQKGDVSIVLIFQEQFFSSALSSVAGQCCNSAWLILTHLPHWMCFLIFIQSSTMDWYLEVKIQAGDKQYSSCLLIQETKNMKILNILFSLYHVEHNTCIVYGRNIKTRYFGLILILRFERDWHSIRHDRMQLSSKETLPAYCIPKVVGLKTGEVLYEKAYMSPRPPPKISLCHDWTKELDSKVVQQPQGEVARQAKFFQPNQFQVQSVINQGNLLSRKTWSEKRPRSQESVIAF